MGILDDAIREHLELKRKHGVPEDEVERQEEEALGPARRDVAQQPEDDEIAAEAVDDASLFDGEEPDAPAAEAPVVTAAETAIAQPPATEHTPAVEEPPEAEPAVTDLTGMEPPPDAEPEPEPEPEPIEPEAIEPDRIEPEPAVAEAPLSEPPVDEAPPQADPDETLGDTEPHGFPALDKDEPDEHDFDEHGDSPDEPLPSSDVEEGDELDVLEDTPDFLQETPEHDRLWFEQKPPRDFDFD